MKLTRPPTVEDLARHVQDLASSFNVAILHTISRVEDGRASQIIDTRNGNVLARICEIVPVTDEATYAVALHELGHLIAPNGQVYDKQTSEQERLRVMCEHVAWDWAEHHALDWTVTMEHMRVQALESYERQKRERQADLVKQEASASRRSAELKTFLKKIGTR